MHGQTAVEQAEKISQALFADDFSSLTAAEIEQGFSNVPSVDYAGGPVNIVAFLVDATQIESSRRQAREDIRNGAIYINGVRQQDVDFQVDPAQAFEGKFVIVRKGKKKYTLVRTTASLN